MILDLIPPSTSPFSNGTLIVSRFLLFIIDHNLILHSLSLKTINFHHAPSLFNVILCLLLALDVSKPRLILFLFNSYLRFGCLVWTYFIISLKPDSRGFPFSKALQYDFRPWVIL